MDKLIITFPIRNEDKKQTITPQLDYIHHTTNTIYHRANSRLNANIKYQDENKEANIQSNNKQPIQSLKFQMRRILFSVTSVPFPLIF